jgi:tubulin-folding cofactor B
MTVRLSIYHSILRSDFGQEKLFELSLTIRQLKKKLETIVGTPPPYMKLSLRQADEPSDAIVAHLDDDDKTLGEYHPSDGQVLYVEDIDPNHTVAQLQEISKVEKFQLSDEEYKKRENTFLKWKEQQKRNNTNKPLTSTAETITNESMVSPENIKVGDRCIAKSENGSLNRRGTVMYVGPVDFAKGEWVGIKLDEPLGKNDGSVGGKKYFTCPPNHGLFVKRNKVIVENITKVN